MSGDSGSEENVKICNATALQFVLYTLNKGEEGWEINEWVEDAYKRFITDREEFSSRNKYMTKHCGKPAVQQLFILLRECLLTHRWQDVLHTLQALVQAPKQASTYVAKATFETMIQNSSVESDHLLSQFVSALKNVKFVDTYEVFVEYMLYLMSQGKIDELREEMKFQQAPGIQLVRLSKPETRRSKHFRILYLGYQGLLWYTEWLNTKQKLTQSSFEGSFYVESAVHTCAKKAAGFFSEVQGEPGVWDVFVFCHVELLEYLEQHEDASTLLKSYVEKNKDNPAALKKLYKHHKARTDGTQAYESLLNLCKLVPSAEEVVELYTMTSSSNFDGGPVVELLFMHLDYQCRKDHLPAWHCLWQYLEQYIDRKADQEIPAVHKCWDERKDWWPVYHFNIDMMEDKTEDSDLLKCKACVAAFLMGTNDFTSTVKDTVEDGNFTSVIERIFKCKNRLHATESQVDTYR